MEVIKNLYLNIDKYTNKSYLYVDAIGYYHKSDLKYNIENDIHYSNLLKFNKKDGYIRIEEIDNKKQEINNKVKQFDLEIENNENEKTHSSFYDNSYAVYRFVMWSECVCIRNGRNTVCI